MWEKNRKHTAGRKEMKTFNQYLLIQEVGDQPYKWKRTKSRRRQWQATFKTDNKQKYVFQADKYDGQQWNVVFYLFGASWHPEDDSMGVTGSQGTSAVRVFSTVAKIFETFVKEVAPDMISFAADKSERDGKSVRTKLYSRFAKSFAKKHGYDMKELDKRDEIKFVFGGKKK